MKKQKRQFIALLIVLVLCVAAYGLVTLYNKKSDKVKEDSEEAAKISLTNYKTEDVTAFSYMLNGTKVSFTNDGDDWIYDNDTSIDLSESSVESLLSSASALTAAEQLEDAGELSDYGLENPSNTITITTSDKTITMYVGDCNDMLSEYYVMMEGNDNIYLVDSTTATIFNKTIESLTDTSTTE